jgi:hypothetical protein
MAPSDPESRSLNVFSFFFCNFTLLFNLFARASVTLPPLKLWTSLAPADDGRSREENLFFGFVDVTSSFDHALMVSFAFTSQDGDGGSFGANERSSITSLVEATRDPVFFFFRFVFFFLLAAARLGGRARGAPPPRWLLLDMFALLAVGANRRELAPGAFFGLLWGLVVP